MHGLDEWIARLGSTEATALVAALLLGLRHATDPDHLTAVSTLFLAEERNGTRRAALLGFAWGLGHATTLLLFGVPVIWVGRYLPHGFQVAAEALIGILIVALAIRLLLRWRRGCFHFHPHSHGLVRHAHPHLHEHVHGEVAHPVEHVHAHADALGRSPLAAFGIGLVHGVGGSAGVGVLLVGALGVRAQAVIALLIFAGGTALSMALVSTLFGYAVAPRWARRRLSELVPLLGTVSLLFGVWYSLEAIREYL